jgi:hypothetical protein
MGADGGGYGRNYSVESVPLVFPSTAPGDFPVFTVPRIPDNVYPTSHQNRRRNEWTPTSARNSRKWTRTGR